MILKYRIMIEENSLSFLIDEAYSLELAKQLKDEYQLQQPDNRVWIEVCSNPTNFPLDD